jgi:2-polyprenyl-3-methyl-5-hydroxy-6-metoxy-1,4-benzoquinol methylase
MNKNKITKYIEEIKIQLNHIQKELEVVSSEAELENLKNLLNSSDWPEAVLDFQIVDENSEEEKMDRAEGVVDILISDVLENKKFLDFGCGEGHMTKYSSTQKTAYSVGYDIVKTEKSKLNWEVEEENCLLTTDFEKVKEKGPYDIVLIYDVLDHTENPVNVLEKAKSVLSDTGNIYLRCHPWCGRHGSHLYRQINKAFVHLVFSEEELKEMGYVLEEYTSKVITPINSYKTIIEKANLKIKPNYPDVEYQDVEDFFKKTKIIEQRITSSYQVDKKFPEFQMSQCFLDYVLTK